MEVRLSLGGPKAARVRPFGEEGHRDSGRRNGVGRSDKVKMEAVLVNCGQMILLLALGFVTVAAAGALIEGVVAGQEGAVVLAPVGRLGSCRADRARVWSLQGNELGPHPQERCSLTKRFRFLR